MIEKFTVINVEIQLKVPESKKSIYDEQGDV